MEICTPWVGRSLPPSLQGSVLGPVVCGERRMGPGPVLTPNPLCLD